MSTIAAARAIPVSGQISIGGYDAAIGSVSIDAATGLDFINGPNGSLSPGSDGTIASFGAGYGAFVGLNCAGSCGLIKDIASFSSFVPITGFLALSNTDGRSVSFDLNSLDGVTRVEHTLTTPGALIVNGSGVIHLTGYDDTIASFSLTTQAGGVISFSATALSVAQLPPSSGISITEPASVFILGCSLVGLGLLNRRPISADLT